MKKLVMRILTCTFGLIFIVSLYNLYIVLREYRNNKATYNNISNIVINDDNKINIQNTQYSKLKSINENYLFWISIPDTNINYPVVKSGDNEEYLSTNFMGEKNKGGCIFVDSRNSLEDDNIIIYGHNMKDKSMFGTLSYLFKSEYLSKNKTIYIYLDNKILEYEIFSVYITNGDTFPYKNKFANDEEFNDYINLTMSKSFYEFDYEDDGKKNIITLSTCTNATGDERTIVNAKLKSINSLN